jgi:UDP-N-acetylglucosamine 2-epimerase (non-hydrolysing)
MRILTVFGTRPEAIKMCPLVLRLNGNPSIDSRLCVTAQHREMLDQVLTLFGVVPGYDLDIMRLNQTLGEITRSVVMGLEAVIEDFKPDVVLVHGDTTSSFSAALAAFYCRIPIGHVDAGLPLARAQLVKLDQAIQAADLVLVVVKHREFYELSHKGLPEHL